jgi:hypothetical protein
VNVQEAEPSGKVECASAKQWEVRMSVLHQMVPIFFVIQFVVVLVAMVAAMLLADPQYSLPAGKSSRCVMARDTGIIRRAL